ncbi:MAG TPA: RDD family protein [Galbitalea sp.]
MSEASRSAAEWPGKRLGLPASGPRSVGRIGRRLGAIAVDWGLSYLISFAFFRPDVYGFATLTIFAIGQVVFLLLLNASVGHLIFGLRLVPIVPGYLGWWRPFVRTILLVLVIPAVIFDQDQRGLHDRWVGTVLVRR